MHKSAKYAINGAIGGGIINAILNAIRQFNEMDRNPNQKFNCEELLIATGRGVTVGGAIGFAVGSIKDYHNSRETPLNTDIFLDDLINQIKLSKSDTTYVKLNQIADQLIELLQQEYCDLLSSAPMKLGSTEKGTALKDNFDIDICLAFKPDSFRSTSDMYYDLQTFLKSKIGKLSILRLREQKKSIGVYVFVRNTEFKIDIVSCKITKGNKTSGYLHKNEKGFFFNKPSYTKTDVHLITQLHFTKTQQKIILLLKTWRNKNDLPLSSHLLENLVLHAYSANYGRIPKALSQKVVMVLQYIAENLNSVTIKSIENTNNILTDISETSKDEIIQSCINVIQDYQYQPNSIIEIFA